MAPDVHPVRSSSLPPPAGRLPGWLFAVVLVAVLGAGTALRLHRLPAESLWLDEACSVMIAQQPLPDLVGETAADVHPPLYYVALHYWMPDAGRSEAAVRGLSVLFGIAGIAAAALLTRRLFGPGTALLAAALLAASPFHLFHSQQARMYPLLALAATLSMHAFVALQRRRPSRLATAGYVAATVAMLYTHVYGLFVVAAQHLFVGAMWLASRRVAARFVRRWIVLHGLIALAFVPWAVVLVQQIIRVEQGFWIARWPAWLLPYTFVVQTGSWWLAAIVVPLALGAVAVAWWPSARRGDGTRGRRMATVRTRVGIPAAPLGRLFRGASRDQWRTLLLVLWLACPVLLPFAISQWTTPIFLPKYTLASAVALAILAAHGLARLGRRPLQAAAALALVGASAVALDAYFSKSRNDRWRDAVARFEQQARTGDVVLFAQPWGQVAFDYYLTRRDVIERGLPPNLAAIEATARAAVLESAAWGYQRIWIVVSQTGPLGDLQEQLAPGYVLRVAERYRGVQLYLFERSPADVVTPAPAAAQ